MITLSHIDIPFETGARLGPGFISSLLKCYQNSFSEGFGAYSVCKFQ
jgi:hypothetical protein